MRSRNYKNYFLALFLVCTFLMLLLIQDFFGVIFFSLVFAIILNPIYRLVLRILKINSYAASFLTLFLLFLLSVLPLYYFLITVYVEVVNFKNFADNYSFDQVLYTTVDNINSSLKSSALGESYLLNFYDTKNYLNQIYNSVYNRIFGLVISASQTSLSLLLKFIFFILFTFYLIPNLKNIESFIEYNSFINPVHTRIFIKKYVDFIKAFMKGVIPVAVIQGLSAGVLLVFLGVPNSLLLTIIMIFLSIIPFLGSGLTMFIIAVFHFLNGDTTNAFIIFIWNLLVVTNIDNVFRTILISKNIKLHPLLMFFSIIFGIKAFGIGGLFYGPLIVIFFITCFTIYKQDYLVTK